MGVSSWGWRGTKSDKPVPRWSQPSHLSSRICRAEQMVTVSISVCTRRYSALRGITHELTLTLDATANRTFTCSNAVGAPSHRERPRIVGVCTSPLTLHSPSPGHHCDVRVCRPCSCSGRVCNFPGTLKLCSRARSKYTSTLTPYVCEAERRLLGQNAL